MVLKRTGWIGCVRQGIEGGGGSLELNINLVLQHYVRKGAFKPSGTKFFGVFNSKSKFMLLVKERSDYQNWIEQFFCSYRVHSRNQWVVNRLTKCANSLLIWENKLPWPKPLTPFLWYAISDIQWLVETRSDKVLKLFLATAEKTWSVKKLSIIH